MVLPEQALENVGFYAVPPFMKWDETFRFTAAQAAAPDFALDPPQPVRSSALEQEVTSLFDQYRDPLFRYLFSVGLTVQDSEEIIQETFFALFRHLRNGQPRHSLRGWIFRVGHNLALKIRTRQYSRAVSLDEETEQRQRDLLPNPEQLAAAAQWQNQMAAVVRALPEQDRACLSLRAEGFRYREIGEILGISLGSVAASLERSLAKLNRADRRYHTGR